MHRVPARVDTYRARGRERGAPGSGRGVASADRGAWPGPAPREEALGEAAGDAMGRPREARGLGWAALAPSAAPGGRAVRGSGAERRAGAAPTSRVSPLQIGSGAGAAQAEREGGTRSRKSVGARTAAPRGRAEEGAPRVPGGPPAPLSALSDGLSEPGSMTTPVLLNVNASALSRVSARPLPRIQLFPEFEGLCQIPPGIERRWGRWGKMMEKMEVFLWPRGVSTVA